MCERDNCSFIELLDYGIGEVGFSVPVQVLVIRLGPNSVINTPTNFGWFDFMYVNVLCCNYLDYSLHLGVQRFLITFFC